MPKIFDVWAARLGIDPRRVHWRKPNDDKKNPTDDASTMVAYVERFERKTPDDEVDNFLYKDKWDGDCMVHFEDLYFGMLACSNRSKNSDHVEYSDLLDDFRISDNNLFRFTTTDYIYVMKFNKADDRDKFVRTVRFWYAKDSFDESIKQRLRSGIIIERLRYLTSLTKSLALKEDWMKKKVLETIEAKIRYVMHLTEGEQLELRSIVSYLHRGCQHRIKIEFVYFEANIMFQ